MIYFSFIVLTKIPTSVKMRVGDRMNGVIYARYSSDNQREESIDGQLRECRAFAEKNEIRVIDSYIDRALSAKTDNRPQFQQMIKDSNKGYLMLLSFGNLIVLLAIVMILPIIKISSKRMALRLYLQLKQSAAVLKAYCLNQCWRDMLSIIQQSLQKR